MQGLQNLSVLRFFARRLNVSDQRGWALIDALASAVVVVLAFTGTTMAFNGSTASVQRDEMKTNAMIVAQNEINEMRAIGTRNINALIAKDGTTETVTYQGSLFNVAFDAYYVTGLGSDDKDACEVSYQANGSTARYIYMRARVTYQGQVVTGPSSSNSFVSSPASLDSYFSPEGGGTQADTGTLRVYVLRPNNTIATGITSVSLVSAGGTGTSKTALINPATGCALFTGLVRDTYQLRVPITGLQDLYLTNTAAKGYVSQKIVMPDRGALSREIRLAYPVSVAPTFWANNTDNDFQVTGGNTNPFFQYWIAGSDQIRLAPTTDYLFPGSLIFMPHADGSAANAMFPQSQGYSTYAGPCDINNPNIGADEGVNNWTQIPAVGSQTTTWASAATAQNLSITPQLWLSQLRPKIQFGTYSATRPVTTVNGTYYYNPTLNGATTVRVRLTGDASGQAGAEPNCKPNTNLFNTWQSLPGSLTALDSPTLPDNAEALPTGTYDVCFSVPYRMKKSTRTSGGWGSESNQDQTSSFMISGVQIPYNTQIDAPFAINWSSPWTSAVANNTSTCT